MLAYGTTISPDKIYVRGIENITSRDFEFAKKLGYTIKLLVVIRYHEGQEDALELRVQPCFVHDWHILASVNGVFNAISVNGDIVGETLFYGRGAGKNPTASAVISDVITAMREKPAFQFLTNTGLYLVEPEVLEDIGEDEVIGFPDIIERQRRKGRRVSAYTVGEADWLDMGQLDELEKMRERLYGKP